MVGKHDNDNELIDPLQQSHKKHHWLQATCLIACGLSIFMIGILAGRYSTKSDDETTAFLNKVKTVYEMMQDKWYYHDSIENVEQELQTNALLGLTMTNEDPHTSYLTIEDTDAFFTSIDANAVGLGVSYVRSTSAPLITAVYKGSGADLAGIREGDIIVSIDGINVADLDDISDIQDYALGDAGTSVVVEVLRDGEVLSFDVTRADFSASVYGKTIENNIGYLKINDFGSTTANDARGYLDDMIANGVHQLIIDLRNDGGGYLTAMQDIASLFIPEGQVVLTTQDSDGNQEIYKSKGDNYTQFDDFIILIDGNTASAAEAFTLAMKDCLDHVTIMGSLSYGKGSVQSSYALGDGSYLKLTTSKWFAPDGSSIDGVGISPDITVYLDDALTSLVYVYDENEPSTLDTVSYQTRTIQQQLSFLGYPIIREDGYMDQTTLDSLQAYCDDHGYDLSDGLNQTIYDALYDDVNAYYASTIDADAVLVRAIEEMEHA